MTQDTIYALSSGALPAAIAIVRLSGPMADAAAGRFAGTLPPPRQASLRQLRADNGDLIDEALLLRFEAPHTATGEPLVECHLHGGRAVVARFLAELSVLPGLREAEPGEFTRRALLNGRLDLTQAEGLGDLLSAETEWQRRVAVESAGGQLRREIMAWRERLISLSAQAEAAIDYVGDEDETSIDLRQLREKAQQLRSEWNERLATPSAELLENGLRVVLAGPPNSGKSSLFNALVGSEKAIVTAQAGTTRDLIETHLDLEGIPVILVDSAGLRDSDDEVERIGIDRAERAIAAADLLLWLGAACDAPKSENRILVHSRADEREAAPPGSVPTSIRTTNGVDELRHALVTTASLILPPPDRAALNRRQIAALQEAEGALGQLSQSDIVIIADSLRHALSALDRLTVLQGTEEVLDEVFTRFCLGK